MGFRTTAHAGEAAGPQSVWGAISRLHVDRIGHGTSAHEDPELLDYLAIHGIPLELCPTSNVRTGAVSAVKAHPIRHYFEHGLIVSVNTDDPKMFGSAPSHGRGADAGGSVARSTMRRCRRQTELPSRRTIAGGIPSPKQPAVSCLSAAPRRASRRRRGRRGAPRVSTRYRWPRPPPRVWSPPPAGPWHPPPGSSRGFRPCSGSAWP